MSLSTMKKVREAWERMNDPNPIVIEGIRTYRGKRFDIGEIVVPNFKLYNVSIEQIMLSPQYAWQYINQESFKRLPNISTTAYDLCFHDGSAFIIFNLKLKAIKVKKDKKEFKMGKPRWELMWVPVYDIVKIDDPSKMAYEVSLGQLRLP